MANHQARPAQPSPPSAAVVRKYNVKRSCIRCHERKCRYPGPERAKRVKSRSQNAVEPSAVAPANTEAQSGGRSTQSNPGPGPRTAPQTRETDDPGHLSTVHCAPSESEQSGGFLLKEGSSTRYVNEFTFSRILDKQGELQSAIDTPQVNRSSGGGLSVRGFDGLISEPTLPGDITSLLPSRWQATKLWQAYLNNVDCLVKLLHIPTFQQQFFAAINNPNDTAPDMNALLFAIYYAAATSLRWTEVEAILGQDRKTALGAYERGLELSLHATCFLDSPTVLSLQAMALYLMCYRNSSSGRTGWILNGLLTRAAVAIGLHRDGEQFNLSPLDCEIRRRLWWQILGSDGRVAEDHGLAAGPNGGFDGFCDTKLPTHIDDRDVTPSTTSPAVSQRRWTELTHYLVASEMYQALQQINRLSAETGEDKMARLEQFLESVKTSINDKYLQYCDPNIPNQKCSLLLGRLLLGKSEIIVRQQAFRGLTPEEAAAHATEEMLALACDALELAFEMKTDELLGNFQWLVSTFTEYHLLTYTLWHLCVRPEAASADRAWTVVDKMFTLIEMQGVPGGKWNVLRKLKEKAAGVRRTAHGGPTVLAAVPPRPPDRQLGGDLQQQLYQNPLDAPGDSPMFTDAMMWDLGYLVFPDWGGNPSGF